MSEKWNLSDICTSLDEALGVSKKRYCGVSSFGKSLREKLPR